MSDAIGRLRERTEQVLSSELDRSLRRRLKHLPDGDRNALRAMLHAAVGALLHEPAARLQSQAVASAQQELDVVRELFALRAAS